MFTFVIVLLAAPLPAVSADELATCADDRGAIVQSWPEYPTLDQAADYFGHTTRYLHVFVAGTVTVRLVVLASGDIESVEVLESSYELVGRNQESYKDGYFDDFHPANVTRKVERWKFRPADQTCQMTRTFTYKFQDRTIPRGAAVGHLQPESMKEPAILL